MSRFAEIQNSIQSGAGAWTCLFKCVLQQERLLIMHHLNAIQAQSILREADAKLYWAEPPVYNKLKSET